MGDALVVRTGEHRWRSRSSAVAASFGLHAAILAAAVAAGLAGDATTDPQPLTVELVVASDGGGTGDASGSGTSPGGDGRSAGATAVPAADAAAAAVPPLPPAPSAAPRPRTAAAPDRPNRRQPSPAKAAVPAAPATADDPVPPAPVAVPTPAPATADDAAAKSPAGGSEGASGDPLSSAGGGASAGSGRGPGSGTGSGAGGSGTGAGGSGPGFSLGSAANPSPPYPPLARRRGIEGTVVLRVEVSAEGRALAVDIARSSGSSMLDEAARDTIARWRFRPARRGGEAVAAATTVPVRFSLTEP